MKKVILFMIPMLLIALTFSPVSAIDTKYDDQATYLDTFYGVKRKPLIIQGTDKTGTVRSAVIDPKEEEKIEPPKKIVED